MSPPRRRPAPEARGARRQLGPLGTPTSPPRKRARWRHTSTRARAKKKLTTGAWLRGRPFWYLEYDSPAKAPVSRPSLPRAEAAWGATTATPAARAAPATASRRATPSAIMVTPARDCSTTAQEYNSIRMRGSTATRYHAPFRPAACPLPTIFVGSNPRAGPDRCAPWLLRYRPPSSSEHDSGAHPPANGGPSACIATHAQGHRCALDPLPSSFRPKTMSMDAIPFAGRPFYGSFLASRVPRVEARVGIACRCCQANRAQAGSATRCCRGLGGGATTALLAASSWGACAYGRLRRAARSAHAHERHHADAPRAETWVWRRGRAGPAEKAAAEATRAAKATVRIARDGMFGPRRSSAL